MLNILGLIRRKKEERAWGIAEVIRQQFVQDPHRNADSRATQQEPQVKERQFGIDEEALKAHRLQMAKQAGKLAALKDASGT